MKKIIAVFLVGLLLAGLVGCGMKGEKSADSTESTESSTTKKDTTSIELPLTAKFPMFQLFIDGPNYQFIEKGATSLYNVGGNRFIALTSTYSIKVDKPNEVLDAYFEKFKFAVRTNCNGYDLIKYNIKESKEMEINGINFWRFQGELHAAMEFSARETDFYTVGYTFIKDNTPFQITGVVVSEEQDQKDIDEITTYVDAMVKTIRDEW